MRRHGGSLTLRLAAFFAAAAAAVFVVVGFYLYQALATQLRERDDADLIDRVAFIRHLLEETETVNSVEEDPHRFLDAVDLQRGLLLDMRAADNHSLARNTSVPTLAADRTRVPASRVPTVSDVREEATIDGARVRIVRAVGKVGDTEQVVLISLAHTADGRLALLSAYRLKVLGAVAAGALLTAFLGFLLARRGLSKVSKLADQARAINVNNLQVRLDPSGVPSELKILADTFNDVLSRLEGSFQNLSQFSADLAHDMRTPLNNLMVQTQVALSQTREREEYQELLTSHHEEYERMARMVETMLFLARADHAEIALQTQSLDSSFELQRIAEYFEGPALDAGVSFEVAGAGPIAADALLFRLAVGNLVSNAIRYTPPSMTIRLDAQLSQAGMTIAVSNPGKGIDEQDLPRLFERFYRSDRSRSSSATSSGLGLAIVKSIMKLHGGEVTVRSTNTIVTFSLFFPGCASPHFPHAQSANV